MMNLFENAIQFGHSVLLENIQSTLGSIYDEVNIKYIDFRKKSYYLKWKIKN